MSQVVTLRCDNPECSHSEDYTGLTLPPGWQVWMEPGATGWVIHLCPTHAVYKKPEQS